MSGFSQRCFSLFPYPVFRRYSSPILISGFPTLFFPLFPDFPSYHYYPYYPYYPILYPVSTTLPYPHVWFFRRRLPTDTFPPPNLCLAPLAPVSHSCPQPSPFL